MISPPQNLHYVPTLGWGFPEKWLEEAGCCMYFGMLLLLVLAAPVSALRKT